MEHKQQGRLLRRQPSGWQPLASQPWLGMAAYRSRFQQPVKPSGKTGTRIEPSPNDTPYTGGPLRGPLKTGNGTGGRTLVRPTSLAGWGTLSGNMVLRASSWASEKLAAARAWAEPAAGMGSCRCAGGGAPPSWVRASSSMCSMSGLQGGLLGAVCLSGMMSGAVSLSGTSLVAR